MTNENIIKQLKRLISSLQYADDVNAVKAAIKALSQEPTVTSTDETMTMVYPTIVCDDAISRQAVLNIAKSSKSNWIDNSVLFKRVNNLPSVTPKSTECDDAISREAAINIASLHCLTIDETVKALEQLPSVTQKSGKWVLMRTSPTKLHGEHIREYQCSECYRGIRCTESQLVNYPYCHCGAKMESEDNE